MMFGMGIPEDIISKTLVSFEITSILGWSGFIITGGAGIIEKKKKRLKNIWLLWFNKFKT